MIATETHKQNAGEIGNLRFKHFPGFAKFLLENHLVEYIKEQLLISKEVDLPLLNQLSHIPEDQLIELSIVSHSEFLNSAIENKLDAYIETSSKRWLDDQLGIIGREQVAAEDITLAGFVRNTAMLKFLPLYTTDVTEIIALVTEINTFSTYSETASTNTFIKILRSRINEHAHFIESVANTTPSIIYVYDCVNRRELYTNNKMTEILGFSEDDLKQKGSKIIEFLAHPDDTQRLLENERNFQTANNGEIRPIEYRIKDKSGNYRWMRAYESVFKRNAEGFITEKIGVAIDIDEQKRAEEELRQREQQLLEAQSLVNMGSYVMDVATGDMDVTPQYLKIFEIEDQPDRNELMKGIHPGDREKLKQARDKAIQENGIYECEYRHIVNDKEKIIWARGHVSEYQGKKVMKGTVIDVTDRHYMIQRLVRSEALYKQAQELAGLGNWVWDVIHNTIEWSDELFNIYEIEPGTKITYDLISSHNHPADAARVREIMTDAIANPKQYEFLYRIVLASGRIKTLHARGETKADENGKTYKLLGTLQDVTERQELIERLEHNEKLYKEAQALAHLGNFTHDLRTGVVTWTDEIYRIYGLEPQSEEPTIDTIVSFMHPDDKDLTLKQIQDSIKYSKPHDCRYKILLRDGTVKVVHRKGEIIKDEAGNPISMNGTLQDVTKEFFTEQALIENQEFISKIANTSPSLIASYNINTGKYTYINSAFEKILGYPVEKVLDEGMAFFLEIIHPDDLPLIMEKNAAALEEANSAGAQNQDEMIAEFKYRLKHKDGYYRWFHTYGTVFDRDENGMVEHVLNVSVDITEQEDAEQELYRKNLQLQQSNASLEEYAYVASHDLKEPLRKIATFGDRLLSTQYDQLSEDGKLHLEKIISSSRRMQAMISDLLSISLLSGNKEFEQYSLQSILQEVLQTLEYKIEERNAIILSDDLPVANIVPSQFRQLFQNLLSNSMKFVKDDVAPQVQINHKYLKPAEVQQYELAKAKKYLQLTIADNGIGFDNQFSNKIFTIFQRLHGRSEYEGTGIGLAICKKIAENHGGTITADSKPGKGASFTIIIPA